MNRLDKILGRIPALISSHLHILGLIGLGVWLVVLPMLGVHVGAGTELIGGNYTNILSAIGAAIAAGGTVQLTGKARRQEKIIEDALKIVSDLWAHHTGWQHPSSQRPGHGQHAEQVHDYQALGDNQGDQQRR